MSSNSFVIITVYAMACNVKGCGNYPAKTRKIEGKKIKYFSFPKDPALFNKWRQACGKENISPKYARICSKHFADEAFTKPLQQHLLGYSPIRTRKIHPDAIPTLHLHAVPPLTSNENVLAETMPLPVSNEVSMDVEQTPASSSIEEQTPASSSTEEQTAASSSTEEQTPAKYKAKYIAGYVAFRFKSTDKTLGIETRQLETTGDQDWLQVISRGKCMCPSDKLLQCARIMNIEFAKYHGSSLNKENLIFQNLAKIIEPQLKIKIPREALLCLIRTRTYIRLREMNRAIAIANHRQKRRKMSKFTNKKPVY
ncbi:uncharacterized protein LOC112465712 isoform X1 [Temnothorax curvispinosus]|uniref:Uncharacterized protein LOC112465712 isoform X1 n=1 Tax=Temnothorax curvispinosus TaxID=300111 RepID=A0A6J1R8B7_9HYME|nr:uncharacterized protein LOC112465712 isoform X1 [Temnothorax curvispinosus]